jgi:hypothetical protein
MAMTETSHRRRKIVVRRRHLAAHAASLPEPDMRLTRKAAIGTGILLRYFGDDPRLAVDPRPEREELNIRRWEETAALSTKILRLYYAQRSRRMSGPAPGRAVPRRGAQRRGKAPSAAALVYSTLRHHPQARTEAGRCPHCEARRPMRAPVMCLAAARAA